MGELSTICDQGDLKIIWDPDNEDEVSAAKKQFNELTGKGFMAFAVGRGGKKSERIRSFDPDAEKVILAPPLSAG